MLEQSSRLEAGGAEGGPVAAPCTIVIFGAAGDLARRKLVPALYNLALDGVLPQSFAVVGFARREMSDEDFRAGGREGVDRFSRRVADPARWAEFERNLFYVTGSFGDAAAYETLRERIEKIEPGLGIPGNRIFYLSVPPSEIVTCVQHLQAAGLLRRDVPGEPFTRVIVEKPIGHDLESAREIDGAVAAVCSERQIFRIDHYLGKETVQSLLVMRFANSIFEPLWNQKYIDHVQITVAEEEGVGTRANYYEGAGALRDMVQNHILQVLCLVAMEPPFEMSPDVVRDQKVAVLKCLRAMPRGEELDRHVVRAQYAAGFHHGVEVPGYRREERVKADSTTETYVALKAYVDNWRWAGVPFYLRTGKRLPKRASEIAVQFKDVPQMLFNASGTPIEPNVLAIRIQPDEGLSLRIATKLPGPRVRIYPVKMDFRYGSTFGDQSPEAYERLLLDVMAGDATLFMRRDAVEASWSWVNDILEAWQARGTRYLPEYPAGSWGPVEADRLIEADGPGRSWRTL
ncbi:glucose-6-phosphate dehydrogenase [bacterium]|nr:glucose-6-phosphate dehydrogenase [bacterium]